MSCEIITEPIDTLNDLLDFNLSCVNHDAVSPTIHLKRKSSDGEHTPRVLVCHDFAGGYLEDKHISGCNTNGKDSSSRLYRFIHWANVDSFVYFSHHFISIPPAVWISAAHRNGVRILGTFITEWEAGAKICEAAFCEPSMASLIADKLVELAKAYRFDGWLINIENPIAVDLGHMDNLIYFVRCLTLKMHFAANDSLIIWYDAVTSDGKLEWQNELNEKNEKFFDSCDGIFLNYTWKPTNLKFSSKKAALSGDEGREKNVYVGIDVFGRNFYRGGGFNCGEAMKLIVEHSLSAAVFAPGWTLEALPPANFEQNQHLFWCYLSPYLKCFPLNSLPLKTNFHSGYGRHARTADECVYHLGTQGIQPHFLCHLPSDELPNRNNEADALDPGDIAYVPRMSHILDADCVAGSCLCLKIKRSSDYFHLFCCEFDAMAVRDFEIIYRISSASMELATDTSYFVALKFTLRSTSGLRKAFYACLDRSWRNGIARLLEVEIGDIILGVSNESLGNGWKRSSCLLAGSSLWRYVAEQFSVIEGIGIMCINKENSDNVKSLLDDVYLSYFSLDRIGTCKVKN